MAEIDLRPGTSTDGKAKASLTFADVIEKSCHNFPFDQFHPYQISRSGHYVVNGVRLGTRAMDTGSTDGVGTKPDLAERLYNLTGEARHFRPLPSALYAMGVDDFARAGRIPLGVTQVVDVNTTKNFEAPINALAEGMLESASKGKFAVLNGETAELGYRMSGYGDFRVNMNVSVYGILDPNKLINGEKLAPGQVIVALREPTIRSNGLSKARAILEAYYLERHLGLDTKEAYIAKRLISELSIIPPRLSNQVAKIIGMTAIKALDNILGHSFVEQVLVPWHESQREVVEELLKPVPIYNPLIQETNGWVYHKPKLEMVASAHITGGGIPEKVGRMLSGKDLGAYIDPVFEDPLGIQMLLGLAQKLKRPEEMITDRGACEQWNRGIGFVVVTPDEAQALALIELAKENGYEAAIAGHITDTKKVEFRGHSWAID